MASVANLILCEQLERRNIDLLVRGGGSLQQVYASRITLLGNKGGQEKLWSNSHCDLSGILCFLCCDKNNKCVCNFRHVVDIMGHFVYD